jgi:hypothetical protein
MAVSFQHSIVCGEVRIIFSAKPDEQIRGILKAHGFRWSPAQKLWWRRRVTGFADILAALDKALHPGRPDGACWDCGSAEGFFRPYGAATPVYCDECYQAHRDQERAQTSAQRCQDDPMGVDRLYEDQCREVCGL